MGRWKYVAVVIDFGWWGLQLNTNGWSSTPFWTSNPYKIHMLQKRKVILANLWWCYKEIVWFEIVETINTWIQNEKGKSNAQRLKRWWRQKDDWNWKVPHDANLFLPPTIWLRFVDSQKNIDPVIVIQIWPQLCDSLSPWNVDIQFRATCNDKGIWYLKEEDGIKNAWWSFVWCCCSCLCLWFISILFYIIEV